MKAWLVRLAGLFHKKRREREMADELESHLAMHIADNIRAGMTQDEARREAVMKLGGMEPVKEAYRDRGTTPWLEHLILDLRFTRCGNCGRTSDSRRRRFWCWRWGCARAWRFSGSWTRR